MKKRLVAVLLLSVLFMLPSVHAAFTAALDRMEIEFDGDWSSDGTSTITLESPQFIARTHLDFQGGDGIVTFYNGSTAVKTVNSKTTGSGWHTVNFKVDKITVKNTDADKIEYAFFATVTNKTTVNRNELTDMGPISLYFPTTAFDSDLDDQRIRTFHSDVDMPSSKILIYIGNTPDDLNDDMSFVDGGASDSGTHIYGCVDGNENGDCDYLENDGDCAAGGGAYYAGRCCGGTGSDTSCGYYPDVVGWCGTTASGPAWAIPEDAGRVTTFTSCPSSAQLLGTGTALHYCGSSVSSGASAFPSGVVSVTQGANVHDFSCISGVITECAGSQTPFSGNWDVVGDLVNISGVLNYCTSDGDYTTNLDGKNKESCETYGFTWTGTKCCSEADDPNETYEDPGTVGACWNKTFVPNGAFLADSRIAAITGTLQGCKTNASYFGLPSLPHYNPACTVFAGASAYGQLYCSNTFQWKLDTLNSNRSINKSIAWAPNATSIVSDCCGATACWTGDKCQADQTGSALPLNYNGYRCEGGMWVERILKRNWDGTSTGYCQSPNQCLVDPNGLAANNNDTDAYFDTTKIRPQCIAPGQTILDHSCEDGTWTTRTKYLGLRLLDYADDVAPTNYRMFCGTSTEALNTPEDVAALVSGASCSILGTSVPCVNNFCVLSTPSGTAWGVTLNKPVNDAKSILTSIGKDADLCDSVTGTEYGLCGEGIWYNPAQNAIISIPSGSLGTESFFDLFITFIKAPLDTLKTFVYTYLHKPLNDYTFFNNTHTFNKMYAARSDDKQLFAFLEEGQFENSVRRDYIGATYDGINLGTSPCTDLILRYDNLASCNSTSGTLEIIRQRAGSPTTPAPIISAWKDLTAKLRPN